MNEGRGVFVFGASGHGKVVIDALERSGRERVLFVCDDSPDKRGTRIMGYCVVDRETLLARRSEAPAGIVSIGHNAIRMQVAAWLLECGFSLASAVHPAATVGRDVEIAEGTVVMAGCVINSGARVGANTIINTGATVDHDCDIGDGVHIGPGAHLCGHVVVGSGTLVGAGSVVVPSVRIGQAATVGAGSTVLRDIPDRACVGGSPCRPLRT